MGGEGGQWANWNVGLRGLAVLQRAVEDLPLPFAGRLSKAVLGRNRSDPLHLAQACPLVRENRAVRRVRDDLSHCSSTLDKSVTSLEVMEKDISSSHPPTRIPLGLEPSHLLICTILDPPPLWPPR